MRSAEHDDEYVVWNSCVCLGIRFYESAVMTLLVATFAVSLSPRGPSSNIAP